MAIRSSRTRPTKSAESGFSRLLKRKWLLANLAGSLIVLIIAAGYYFTRDRGPAPKHDGDNSAEAKPANGNNNPPSVAPPAEKVELVLCRIYTPQPGFSVFIDGNPVRKQTGDERLTTPCEVAVPRGPHQISVAKTGFRDAHENVNLKENLQEVDFHDSSDAVAGNSELLGAAHLNASPRQPIRVFPDENTGEMYDPYVTPDGSLLYFVGNRGGYKGIYYASRSSAYARFDGEPTPIKSTRGYVLPASPSLSSDNLSIVYTQPKLGVIFTVSRESPVGEFINKKAVMSRGGSRGEWLSVQAVSDGQRAWWLYWLERVGEKKQVYAATSKITESTSRSTSSAGGRVMLASLPKQKFQNPEPKESLQGKHPCLSRDGLRQYVFDGKFLKRAERASFSAPFSEYKLVTSMDLGAYSPAPNRRSFSITDDEQWLFYENQGKLYMVRVFDGPGRGFIARGTSIPQRVRTIAKKSPKKKMPEVVVQNKTPPKKIVDPRTLPLPYPLFRDEFVKLIKAREYAKAKMKLASGLADDKLAKDRNLIAWDRDELELVNAFWNDVETAVKTMKPNDEFSIGSARVRFASYADGVLTAKSATKTVTKPLREMRPSDLIAFVEKQFGRKDPLRQARIAMFLHHDAEGSTTAAASRFDRAGAAGKQFHERQPARLLQQARQEIARENVARGLILAKRIIAEFPKSPAAAGAGKLNEQAYLQIKWMKQGGRVWREADGAYTAAKSRSPGSMLRSPQQFENFELRLEWKSDVAAGQGGVYFRYPGSGNPVDTAFKLQLSDDLGVRADNYCTGALFKVEAPTVNAVKKRGEWNTLSLQVRGEAVTATINGRKVLDTKAVSETIPKKGYVALDGALGGITYRKILLIELPAEK